MKKTHLLAGVYVTVMLFPSANASVIHNEMNDGDLGDSAPYTNFGTLAIGNNTVIGTLNGGELTESDNTTNGEDEYDTFFFVSPAEWNFEYNNTIGQDVFAFILDTTNFILYSMSSTDSVFFNGPLGAGNYRVDLFPHENSLQSAYEVNLVVGSVPIPASVCLFGSGLLGLIGISRRKKAA